MNKYLKAWIKIKPIYYFEKEWGGWCECPFCNEEVDEEKDKNFCQSCGQALDWSEDV